MRDAELSLSRQLAEAMYRIDPWDRSYAPPPVPWLRRALSALNRRSLLSREWIARKILRVDLWVDHEDDY
jgi:hypothetical protein